MEGIAPPAADRQDPVWRLLDRRFGDGLVYLAEGADRPALRRAIGRGLLTPDGYLTRAGRRYWQAGAGA